MHGDAVEKEAMVRSLRASAQAAGVEILTEDGEYKISGHLGRIADAAISLGAAWRYFQ